MHVSRGLNVTIVAFSVVAGFSLVSSSGCSDGSPNDRVAQVPQRTSGGGGAGGSCSGQCNGECGSGTICDGEAPECACVNPCGTCDEGKTCAWNGESFECLCSPHTLAGHTVCRASIPDSVCCLDAEGVPACRDQETCAQCGEGANCDEGELCCNSSECIASDFENCGACGNDCTGVGDSCTEDQCMCGVHPACSGSADTCCGGGCVDLDSDVGNCGSCGNACEAYETCNGGVCEGLPCQNQIPCQGNGNVVCFQGECTASSDTTCSSDTDCQNTSGSHTNFGGYCDSGSGECRPFEPLNCPVVNAKTSSMYLVSCDVGIGEVCCPIEAPTSTTYSCNVVSGHCATDCSNITPPLYDACNSITPPPGLEC